MPDQTPKPQHNPVMPDEVVDLLGVTNKDTVVDGTFGSGGHARRIARHLLPDGAYIAIDRDPSVAKLFDRFALDFPELTTRFIQATFVDAFRMLKDEGQHAAAIMLDIGVSSMQLDQAARGFSYMQDAPLDMRMDPACEPSAAQLIATIEQDELEQILRDYGEERFARRIASAIARQRVDKPITTTGQLVELVLGAIPAKARHAPGGHPAKRTFQALRIVVNDELGMLDKGLDAAFDLLEPGGKLLVLSFHSLEDRLVKRRFERWLGRCECPPGLPVCACGELRLAELVVRGALRPQGSEIQENSRSASTKLRCIRKLKAPQPVGGAYE